MIGRFLELGLPSASVLDSIGFYEELGFRQLNTGDIWQYPYAVLSDGRINIGLHDAPLAAPMLTFVLPDLASEIIEFRSRGIDFITAQTSDDQFNELVFADPDGNHVRIIEARTFSPAHFEQVESKCGRFREITLPVRDLEMAAAYWQRLGLDELGSADEPHPHVWLRGDGIVIGLHQSAAMKQPALSFQSENLSKQLAALRHIGIETTTDAPIGVAALATPEAVAIYLHGL
ncbi:MAG: hypothetical protein KJO54_08740 [Gammaproteobacteria bacterium]|nr:hypothetical protein [Gammaproteobacteria bacterium]NNF60327.1 hypothetical protein [Gammaproteobacteria bacterium]